MRVVTLLHRWAGGLLGLALAMFGLTGTLLLYREAWLRWVLPHAADPATRDDAAIAAAIARLTADPARAPQTIVLASDGFGLDRLIYAGQDRGAYVDQAGAMVASWSSQRERPELWLFDLHRHILSGDTGEALAGGLALVGLGFVVTGTLLWWRTRRTFALRAWPRRLSRPAIVRHHRDLGIMVAPVLLVSFLTGAMMALRPVETLVLRPFATPSTLAALRKPPAGRWGGLAADPDWRAMIATARRAYPAATIRIVQLPPRPGAPITLRLRQPGEWLPNGSTTLWFDPAGARLIGTRDALALPIGPRLATIEYPLHAGKLGLLAWKAALTIAGIVLTMLGTLAVASFWGMGSRARPAGAAGAG